MEYKEKHIYRCEDTIDGIFTAIFDAWSSRYGHDNIKIIIKDKDDNYELFSKYIDVETDFDKSVKVGQSIRKKIGQYEYSVVIKAGLSSFADKADCIYRFLILGFSMGKGVTEYMQNEYISRVMKMNQRVGYEVHRYLGFVRFKDININTYNSVDNGDLTVESENTLFDSNSILVSVISPDNNILELLDNHFSDRMKNENWIMCDEKRNMALVHRKKSQSVMIKLSSDDVELFKNKTNMNDDLYEESVEDLWKEFFKSIAITERKNYKLQRQMLPIRFRDNMLDFSE